MKEEFIKSFNDLILSKKGIGSLDIHDIRCLVDKGIPAVEIAIKNIPIECFEQGFYMWINEIFKETKNENEM